MSVEAWVILIVGGVIAAIVHGGVADIRKQLTQIIDLLARDRS